MTNEPTPALHTRLLESTLKDIFGPVEAEALDQIRPRMTTHEIPSGTVLMRQGDPSDDIYIVPSGRLRATQPAGTPIALVTRQAVNDALGGDVAGIDAPHSPVQARLADWLDDRENHHAMQVFVADAANTGWTRRCLRARPHISMEGLSHFHTRRQHGGDWARLARILAGQATGVVFAGGGARGFSHLGVMKVLEENGIEWDMAGGTSMGSAMAAYAAMDIPSTDAIRLAGKAFSANPTGDFNWLPLMSLVRGQRLAQVVRGALREATGVSQLQIEDLWKPYFCVASNYSRAEIQVLRGGDMARCIMASVSIPAALPPVPMNGDLLTDGGTFNNYPVDIMRASGAARVIGVDLGRNKYRPLPYQELPSTAATRACPAWPPSCSTSRPCRARATNAACARTPTWPSRPTSRRWGMLQWRAFKRVVAIGEQHARERLSQEFGVFQPEWFESQHTRQRCPWRITPPP